MIDTKSGDQKINLRLLLVKGIRSTLPIAVVTSSNTSEISVDSDFLLH